MNPNTYTKRKYDSSRRKFLALETRKLITESARILFIERGYAGTTIESIAQASAVSTETVYAIFQKKRNILSHLLDIAVGGTNFLSDFWIDLIHKLCCMKSTLLIRLNCFHKESPKYFFVLPQFLKFYDQQPNRMMKLQNWSRIGSRVVWRT